jgi:hypothetical protein
MVVTMTIYNTTLEIRNTKHFGILFCATINVNSGASLIVWKTENLSFRINLGVAMIWVSRFCAKIPIFSFNLLWFLFMIKKQIQGYDY